MLLRCSNTRELNRFTPKTNASSILLRATQLNLPIVSENCSDCWPSSPLPTPGSSPRPRSVCRCVRCLRRYGHMGARANRPRSSASARYCLRSVHRLSCCLFSRKSFEEEINPRAGRSQKLSTAARPTAPTHNRQRIFWSILFFPPSLTFPPLHLNQPGLLL